jgi:hypothetical protein
MTTIEGITDTAAVQGLKAVEDTAMATLVAIERAYEAAMAQVADLATNRMRVMAPRDVDVPRQVVAAPPAPVAEERTETPAGAEVLAEVEVVAEVEVEVVADVAAEVAPEVAPEPRMSPLVEALQALQVVQARAEVTPEPQPTPVTDVFPVVDAAAEAEFTPVVEVIERPRLVDAVWIAGRHAEAKTDQIPVQAA